jgi:hypothetical protein
MNHCAVSVAKDFSGLKQAALELLEEARSAPERERLEWLAQRSANPNEILQASESNRTLSEGHYLRVAYLCELSEFLSMGVQLSFDLDMTELRGMLSIAAARAEFDRAHPPCRGCGKRLENEWDKTCNDCQRAAAAAQARGN